MNNSLGFPGIFRGALDVRARTITDEMCIAAAEALAGAAPDGGMDPDCILPTMIEWEVYAKEAVAVGMKAQEQGIARVALTADELFGQASEMILRSRRLTEMMMETGLIAEPPEELRRLGTRNLALGTAVRLPIPSLPISYLPFPAYTRSIPCTTSSSSAAGRRG